MTPLAEAQARLLSLVTAKESQTLPLHQAHGLYALDTVFAKRHQPAAPLSAMDGYALCGDGPWQVIGESAAGAKFEGSCTLGQCVRIFTGAILPPGTDRVIMQEDVARDGNEIMTAQNPRPGHHVRPRGSDFAEGDLLIAKGEMLTPARLALAAAGGHGDVTVTQQVRVALISTGSELIPPGQPCREDQIPASNDLMLTAQLTGPGVQIENLGTVPDDEAALHATIARARAADIIITIGGASVGDHDLVRPVLQEAGAEMDFWKVAIKPGKPLMAGKLSDKLIIGLPGNPVSAFVTSLLFAKPAIAKMLGSGNPLPSTRQAMSAVALPENGNRTDHIRAVRTPDGVKPAGVNDSAALSALALSDALIVRPPHTPAIGVGEMVTIIPL